MVVVVELAGGEEGKVVARVRDERVDNQTRVPGDLFVKGCDVGGLQSSLLSGMRDKMH